MRRISIILIVIVFIGLSIASCSMIGVKRDDFFRRDLYNPDKAVVVDDMAYIWKDKALKNHPVDSVFRDEVVDIIGTDMTPGGIDIYKVGTWRGLEYVCGYMNTDLKRIRQWDHFTTYGFKKDEGWFVTIDSLNIYERPWLESQIVKILDPGMKVKIIGSSSYDYLIDGEAGRCFYVRASVENGYVYGWVLFTYASLENKISPIE